MARIGRSYPSIRSGLYNAQVVNSAPNVFLPTIQTRIVAVQNVQTVTRRFKPVTKLSLPSVINTVPILFLPTLVKPLLFADQRSFQNSMRKPMSTRIRPPTSVNSVPNLFLPTINVRLTAVGIMQIVTRRFKYKAKLVPPTVVNPISNLFLPTLKPYLQAVRRGRDRDSYIQGSAKLTQVPYLFFPKLLSSLPTLGTHLQAVNIARGATKYRSRAVLLNQPRPVSPIPNLFLPTVTTKLVAVSNRQIITRRFKYGAKLSPATVTNPIPSLFLPTLGRNLNARQRSIDASKFKGKSKYSGIDYRLLIPPAFLPTIRVKLVTIESNLRTRRSFKPIVRLSPPTVIAPVSLPFLPTIKVKLVAPRSRPFKPSTKLRSPILSPANLFLPTLGVHLQAISTARNAYKFRGKFRYTGTDYKLLRSPAFLPTIKTVLQAVRASRRPKYSSKLSPPRVTTHIPNLFLPTLGYHLNANARARDLRKFRGKSNLKWILPLFFSIPTDPTTTIISSGATMNSVSSTAKNDVISSTSQKTNITSSGTRTTV